MNEQDTRPGLPILSQRKGIRFAEEMTVYAEDGTRLGYMTLTTFLLPQVPNYHWLSPVRVQTDITREDILRLRPSQP